MEILKKLHANLVTPSCKLLSTPKGKTVAASSLQMCTTRITEGHFFMSELNKEDEKKILEAIQEDCKEFETLIQDLHLGRILDTQSEVFKNLSRLHKKRLTNEAEVRYCICNPIMDMVCDTFDYKLKLEVTVKDYEIEEDSDDDPDVLTMAGEFFEQLRRATPQLHATTSEPSRLSIGGAMSKLNKADYAVYTFHQDDVTRIVAILDAKHKLGLHAIAQIVGYYAAFNIDSILHPIAMIMSKDFIRFVMFPFVDEEHLLVNAVCFSEIYLWKSDHGMQEFLIDMEVLACLLAILRGNSKAQSCGIPATHIPKEGRIRKNRVSRIFVVDEVKTLRKQLEERNLEIERLKGVIARGECLPLSTPAANH